MSKLKETFRSYLNSEEKQSDTKSNNVEMREKRKTKKEKKKDKSLPDHTFPGTSGPDYEPNLLKGEIVIGKAQQVISYTHYSDKRQGIYGILLCTNFRISFLSYKEMEEGCPAKEQRNKLIGDNDIALTNIDMVYQVHHGNRKKLQSGSSTSLSHGKTLEFHCKDFRIRSFGLKHATPSDIKSIMDAVGHHVFPVKKDLLFAYDYRGNIKPDANVKLPPTFYNRHDWEMELNRLEVKGWKVASWNEEFQDSYSLPECTVIPAELPETDMKKAAPQYIDNRPPVWCYSHYNGCSLLRMSTLIPTSTQKQLELKAGRVKVQPIPEVEKWLIAGINRSHPSLKKSEIIDLREPSVRDVGQAYQKLRSLCMPLTIKDLEEKEKDWFNNLVDTRWLSVVLTCLQRAAEAATYIITDKTVILRDTDGQDLVAIVACLTQILLDDYRRTVEGFQALIQKEWVAMGHRFSQQYGLWNKNDEQCPMFLLFLDCVWQLLQMNPSDFQFSETYLTSLWDSLTLGMFDVFMFDSVRSRPSMTKKRFSSNQVLPGNFLNVWDWSNQFSTENRAVFKNPLYIAKQDYKDVTNGEFNVIDEDLRTVIQPVLLTEDNIEDSVMNRDSNVLNLNIKAANVRLWSQCYQRWLSPVLIMSGGAVGEYLSQCALIDEIKTLQQQIDELGGDCDVFPGVNLTVSSPLPREGHTSCFPFTNVASSGLTWLGSPTGLQSRASTASMDTLDEPDSNRASGTSNIRQSTDSLEEL